MTPWVIATRNTGKVRELAPWFRARGIAVTDVQTLGVAEDAVAESAIEAFPTFAENALAKARYFHQLLGRPVIADDSGLMIDVLDGRPGVRSRRFAADLGVDGGPEEAANNRAVLGVLRASGSAGPWSARFVCAMAFVDAGAECVADGVVEGRFIETPRGTGGFGYDPHMYSDELGMTLAEASVELKNAISHRARACTALLAAVQSARLAPPVAR
jgi:XTP/dITP diphosphohydrolase